MQCVVWCGSGGSGHPLWCVCVVVVVVVVVVVAGNKLCLN